MIFLAKLFIFFSKRAGILAEEEMLVMLPSPVAWLSNKKDSWQVEEVDAKGVSL